MKIQAPRRACGCLVLAAALAVAAPGPGAPGAGATEPQMRTCRHDLYLQSGISEVRVRRVTCRTAIRSVRRWVRDGMPKPGPAGWRCRRSRHGEIAPYVKVRCSRGGARMRFEIGG